MVDELCVLLFLCNSKMRQKFDFVATDTAQITSLCMNCDSANFQAESRSDRARVRGRALNKQAFTIKQTES